eukprot:g46274.t1
MPISAKVWSTANAACAGRVRAKSTGRDWLSGRRSTRSFTNCSEPQLEGLFLRTATRTGQVSGKFKSKANLVVR